MKALIIAILCLVGIPSFLVCYAGCIAAGRYDDRKPDDTNDDPASRE